VLVAGTEGAIPAWMVAGVVSSLQRRYLSGCVFLLHTDDKAELSKHSNVSMAMDRLIRCQMAGFFIFPVECFIVQVNIFIEWDVGVPLWFMMQIILLSCQYI
jgi:hypothetical protein